MDPVLSDADTTGWRMLLHAETEPVEAEAVRIASHRIPMGKDQREAGAVENLVRIGERGFGFLWHGAG